MKTFAKLAQANVDFYNAHPVAHLTLTAVYGVSAFVVFNKAVQRIANNDPLRKN